MTERLDRASFEEQLLREVRDGMPSVFQRGPIVVERVYLDASADATDVVILFRADIAPDCLYGLRFDAWAPDRPVGFHAQIIRSLFMERLAAGDRQLPAPCAHDEVTWVSLRDSG